MNKKLFALGLVLAACAAVCLCLALGVGRSDEPAVTVELSEDDSSAEEELSAEEEEANTYESPIDFAALQKTNEDIYAWLDIPGTEISYAVLQNAEDDTYYLDHAEDKTASVSGSLFTESAYNSTDFTDPVTVIYGHHMKSGAYFGNLQALYSDEETFAEYSEAVIYLPDKELHYTVSAAVPYSSTHILYYNDFTSARTYRVFLNGIYAIRSIGANFNDEAEVDTDDTILILSTCLKGDNTRRYLVLFRLEEVVE